MRPIVTLTTDFGLNDHYVGAMKGVILNINPDAEVVDICHSVQSYDVLDGALTIWQAYSYFPAGTVHVVVVDPGVGTPRRPLLVDSGRYQFIAPDNGVLSFVYDQEERVTVREVTAEHYYLRPVSATFHGRDVFAPIAAYVSKGTTLSMLGDVIADYARSSIPRPKAVGERTIKALVLKVDKFGNLVTNIRPDDIPALFQTPSPSFRMAVGKGEIRALRSTFAEGKAGEPIAIVGSMGFIEIVCNRGSAAMTLAAGKGSDITVMLE